MTSTLSSPPRPAAPLLTRLRLAILIVSVVANVGLLIAIAARVRALSGAASRRPEGEPATAATTPTSPRSLSPYAHADRQTWHSLTAGPLPEVVARLRAAGFPPNLLRAIVTALVDAQFADRHHEIAEMIRARPWWQPSWGGEGMKVLAARQKLRREIQDKVDDLLGPDLGDEYAQAGRRYRYGNLPPAKLALLDRINGDYGELGSEIKAEAGGVLLDSDKEKLLYLAEQDRAEVEQLMTPDELFEYDLRSSSTGWWLRSQLQYLNPSDEEFRAIFKVQHEFMKPFADGNPELQTADMREAMDKADPPLKDRIKAVLSPERFAEYELKTDPVYYATAPLVERLGLPAGATADVVNVQRDISKRADAIRADAGLTGDQRAMQLAALADEANLRLAGTLGDSGLEAYKKGIGRWVTTLKPSAPTH